MPELPERSTKRAYVGRLLSLGWELSKAEIGSHLRKSLMTGLASSLLGASTGAAGGGIEGAIIGGIGAPLLVGIGLYLWKLLTASAVLHEQQEKSIRDLRSELELAAKEPNVQALFTAENVPAAVQVRVENIGERGVFTAAAKVTTVSEQAQNPKHLQTFGLRWRANGKDELLLGTGNAGSLLIASVNARSASRSDWQELVLEGFVDGQPAKVDWFRWHPEDPLGGVTINLDVMLSSSTASGVTTRSFVVKGRGRGGITIEEAETPSETAAPPKLG